ncbi:MAG: hypothetical protein ACKVOL_03000 [Novosphingobium sp.]
MSLQFQLPTPADDVQPAFATAKACAEWVEALPLTNPATAQAQLRSQINLLPCAGFKPVVLFEILEQLRTPLLFVQTEAARKFAFRPLPLADFEALACAAALDLWRAFGLCWQVCVQAALDGEGGQKGFAAAACQRALDVQARLLLDSAQAGAELPGTDWLLLHKLYRAAEQLGVASEKVKDAQLREIGASNCSATYARPVLVMLGSPVDWGARPAQFVARWMERLATKITISALAPANPGKPPVLVDLAAARGGFRSETPAAVTGADIRYLDISDLAVSIKNRINMLRKGQTPASLGLGEDAMPAVEQVLIALYRHWGDGRAGREQARRAAGGRAMVACSFDAMHYYISGKPFKQPGQPRELSSRQRQEIATFGRVSTRDDDQHSLIQGFALEDWAVHDESVAGMRLVRAAGATGARLSSGQLLAIRPSGARSFIMGVVRWAQVLGNGDLMIGVKALPGAPTAVAVRASGLNAAAEKYQPALLLPAVQALQSNTCVLLPAGWFKPDRVLDMYAERFAPIKIVSLDDRGADFERCAFDTL